MSKIDTLMKQRRLKQAEAAGLLGIKQPDVSKTLRGEFSVERLLRFLVALDQDVEIVANRIGTETRPQHFMCCETRSGPQC